MIIIIKLNKQDVEQKYLEGDSIFKLGNYFGVADKTIKRLLESSGDINIINKLKPKSKYNYIINGNIVTLYFKSKRDGVIEATIDLDDLEKFLTYPYGWHIAWHKNTKSYYVRCTIYLGKGDDGKYKNKLFYLHKYLMNAEQQDYVDHEDHNTLNDCKNNLRISINENNTKNRKSKNSNNKSGYRNVSQRGNSWVVQLQLDGVNTVLKQFPLNQLDEAGDFAELMRDKYYGEFKGLS